MHIDADSGYDRNYEHLKLNDEFSKLPLAMKKRLMRESTNPFAFTLNSHINTPKEDYLFWAKVDKDATIPTKRDEDGCYDIYALMKDKAGNEIEEIILEPNQIYMARTGIASSFYSKYRADVSRERGSTGTMGLSVRSGQIDSGYTGEWFVPLHNVSNKVIIISRNVKEKEKYYDKIIYPSSKAICQVALEVVPQVKCEEISYDELVKIPSERGTGKLGDSGK